MKRIPQFALLTAIATMIVMATALIGYGVYQIFTNPEEPGHPLSTRLLNGIGYAIVAIAVFDVAKYLLEEEVSEHRELRRAGEARRSLTKFITIITIAVFLEALVFLFQAGKAQPVSNIIYPMLLLLVGVGMMLGLGLYQRMSADAEDKTGEH